MLHASYFILNKNVVQCITEVSDLVTTSYFAAQDIVHIYIWCKLKLTLGPPCFMVDGVLETTFQVPIIIKIYMCKIQDESVIIISKINLRMIF